MLEGFQAAVHTYVPHSSLALYASAMLAALVAVSAIYARCLYDGCVKHLDEHWLVPTAATAAPIPTYIILLVMPFDNHLAETALKDHVVVALAGLYGLIQACKAIRRTAWAARKTKSQHEAAHTSFD